MSGKVIIEKTNGNLGALAPKEDGVAAMLTTGVAVSGKFEFGEVMRFRSLADAEAMGITNEYDKTNSCTVHRQIDEFYAATGGGGELFVMVVAKTVTMATMVNTSLSECYAEDLLAHAGANGRIRLLGICGAPASEPTLVDGVYPDLLNAVTNAQGLAQDAFDAQRPVSILIEGRNVDVTSATLPDLNGNGEFKNKVSVVISADNDKSADTTITSGDKYANVGYCLGTLSTLPVQRSLGRVKNGATRINNAGFSNGSAYDSHTQAIIDDLDGKGYIFLTRRNGKAGYYWNADHTAAESADDYNYIHRGRVIDKVARLAYAYYTNELNDDILVDTEGKLSPGVIKVYQNGIEENINRNMVGEISSVSAFVDPAQNVLSTNSIAVQIDVVPKGLSETINITLGFKNPQIN